MTRFPACLAFTLAWEGGRVDDPHDHGGRTNRGVTQRTYTAWLARHGRPDADVWTIPDADLHAVYAEGYWTPIHGDELGAGVDLAVFDAAVHSGPAQAVRWLQRAIGAPVDGAVGPVTLAALRGRSGADVVRSVCDQREAFLGALADQPGQAGFLRGWLRRVEGVRGAGAAV